MRCVGTCGALDGRGVDRRARLEGAERPDRGLWPTPHALAAEGATP